MKFFIWASPFLWIICQAGIDDHILAQPSVGFHHDKDTIALGAQGVSYTYQIPVSVQGLTSEDEPVIVDIIDLQTGTADPKMYKIEESSVIFTKDHKLIQLIKLQLKGNYGKLPEYDIHLTISVLSGWAKVDIANFFLTLKVPDNLNHKEQLSAYKLSIGANFDLIDGPSINSSYTDISVFHPQLWPHSPVPHKKRRKSPSRERWGMDIWLYQNRTITEQENSIVNDSGIFAHSFIDTTIQSTERITTDNLGIYFSPMYRLGGSPQSVRNPMQIYLIGQLEFTRFRIVPPESGGAGLIQKKNSDVERLSFIGFTGGGLFFHHASQNIDFILKLTTGITFFDHPLSLSMKPLVEEALPRPGYYQTQLRIQEKQFGLKLGADIRGYFKSKKHGNPNQRYYPSFNLFLAKEFSFAQISKLFGPIGERKK